MCSPAERGASGYNTLVSTCARCRSWLAFGAAVVLDDRPVQQPGGQGGSSGGQREFVETLARAAVAVGVAGLFIETHQDPDNAPSDGPNMVPIDKMPALLEKSWWRSTGLPGLVPVPKPSCRAAMAIFSTGAHVPKVRCARFSKSPFSPPPAIFLIQTLGIQSEL